MTDDVVPNQSIETLLKKYGIKSNTSSLTTGLNPSHSRNNSRRHTYAPSHDQISQRNSHRRESSPFRIELDTVDTKSSSNTVPISELTLLSQHQISESVVEERSTKETSSDSQSVEDASKVETGSDSQSVEDASKVETGSDSQSVEDASKVETGSDSQSVENVSKEVDNYQSEPLSSSTSIAKGNQHVSRRSSVPLMSEHKNSGLRRFSEASIHSDNNVDTSDIQLSSLTYVDNDGDIKPSALSSVDSGTCIDSPSISRRSTIPAFHQKTVRHSGSGLFPGSNQPSANQLGLPVAPSPLKIEDLSVLDNRVPHYIPRPPSPLDFTSKTLQAEDFAGQSDTSKRRVISSLEPDDEVLFATSEHQTWPQNDVPATSQPVDVRSTSTLLSSKKPLGSSFNDVILMASLNNSAIAGLKSKSLQDVGRMAMNNTSSIKERWKSLFPLAPTEPSNQSKQETKPLEGGTISTRRSKRNDNRQNYQKKNLNRESSRKHRSRHHRSPMHEHHRDFHCHECNMSPCRSSYSSCESALSHSPSYYTDNSHIAPNTKPCLVDSYSTQLPYPRVPGYLYHNTNAMNPSYHYTQSIPQNLCLNTTHCKHCMLHSQPQSTNRCFSCSAPIPNPHPPTVNTHPPTVNTHPPSVMYPQPSQSYSHFGYSSNPDHMNIRTHQHEREIHPLWNQPSHISVHKPQSNGLPHGATTKDVLRYLENEIDSSTKDIKKALDRYSKQSEHHKVSRHHVARTSQHEQKQTNNRQTKNHQRSSVPTSSNKKGKEPTANKQENTSYASFDMSPTIVAELCNNIEVERLKLAEELRESSTKTELQLRQLDEELKKKRLLQSTLHNKQRQLANRLEESPSTIKRYSDKARHSICRESQTEPTTTEVKSCTTQTKRNHHHHHHHRHQNNKSPVQIADHYNVHTHPLTNKKSSADSADDYNVDTYPLTNNTEVSRYTPEDQPVIISDSEDMLMPPSFPLNSNINAYQTLLARSVETSGMPSYLSDLSNADLSVPLMEKFKRQLVEVDPTLWQ